MRYSLIITPMPCIVWRHYLYQAYVFMRFYILTHLLTYLLNNNCPLRRACDVVSWHFSERVDLVSVSVVGPTVMNVR